MSIVDYASRDSILTPVVHILIFSTRSVKCVSCFSPAGRTIRTLRAFLKKSTVTPFMNYSVLVVAGLSHFLENAYFYSGSSEISKIIEILRSKNFTVTKLKKEKKSNGSELQTCSASMHLAQSWHRQRILRF